MYKRLILIYFFINFYNITFSQSNLSKQWDKRYGGNSGEGVGAMINTSDGGLLIGGWSVSGIGGSKSDTCRGNWDYWIVKIDANGNKLWDKTFGGTSSEVLNSLNQTNDGGYILGGTSQSGIGGDKTQPSWGMEDYWIVKTDSLGNMQWEKRFGGSNHDFMGEIELSNDGGYLLSGYSDSPISGDKTQANWGGSKDFWVVKIDSSGNLEWDRRYGGTDDEENPWEGGVICSSKCNDGGFIIGGWSVSGIGGDKSQAAWDPNGDYWIIKIDSAGNKLWDKRYGGTDYDALHNIIETFDGNFILGGTTFSGIGGNKTSPNCSNFAITGDYWILKIDSVGNILFDKDYGSNDADYFTSIIQTPDSGFVICGENTFANASCQKSEGYINSSNAWVIKTNSLGVIEWDKSIFGPTISNSTCLALSLGNNCLGIVSGSNGSNIGYNTQPSYGSFDYWLVKFCNCIQPVFPSSSFSVTDTAFCQGSCVRFVDVSDCYNSRLWLFPGGVPSTSVQQIQSVCYPDSGYYPVTLISINPTGTDTLVKNNYIQAYPEPSPPVVIQVGDTLISSPGNNYQWYDSDGNQINGATSQSFVPDSSSYYYVCVENIYGCKNCSENFYFTITGITPLHSYHQSILIIPNPADGDFTLHLTNEIFAANCFVEIYTVYGVKLFSQEINHQKTTYNSKQFPGGIYFFRVFNGEFNYCRKLIIEKH